MSTIPAREFKNIGESLSVGQRIRLEHSCGGGRTLLVSRDGKGISAWCFRCHAKGWIPDERSLAERIQALSQAQEWDQVAADSIELPGPGKMDTKDWPDEPLLWLFKAGFSRDEIEANGWYWNPRMQRVILPVRDHTGKVIYWQGRGFDSSRVKALNPAVNREGLVAKYGQGSVLCLTEDILSAAKVGAVTEAWALLGTVVTDRVLTAVAERSSRVALMLDDDPAGRAGARIASARLALLGVDVRQIYFGRDPKLVARKDIRDAIETHWPGGAGPFRVRPDQPEWA